MKRAMLIWNPAAGRVWVEKCVRESVHVLENAGWKAHLEVSKSAAHITELAQEAVQTKLDAVFVAGGDGSLGRAVSGLVGSDTALGVLPSGTANVWAREIGLTGSRMNMLVESVHRLAGGNIREMDVGLCNGKTFFLWAGLGLDGRVINQLERRRSRFMKQINEVFYLFTILHCSAGWAGTRMRVTADDQTIEGQFMLALAGNIRLYVGGLATLSPKAKWNDGQMELWLLSGGKKGGMGMVIRHLWNLGWGRHVKDREAMCLPFRQLKITFETDEWMQMDGEPLGKVTEAQIKIIERGLKVIVP